MTAGKREKLPAELLARVREVGNLAILAGCTAEEVIALAKQTVADWIAPKGKRT